MTRVLFWNIENFGVNKIYNPSRKRKRGHGGLPNWQAANQRRALLVSVVNATQPDIIVIIEVGSGDNAAGDLATQTGGMNGMVYLQGRLNAAGFPGGWNQVPPLQVGTGGRAEAVGILYRRTNNAGTLNRYFTGPNIWTGGYNGVSSDPTLVGAPAAIAYPAPPPGGGQVDLNAMLVPAGLGAVRQIPMGAQHNGGRNEDRVAARTSFAVNNAGAAGAMIAFAPHRPPYMATFTEATPPPGNVVQRNLSIFGIHAPPQGGAAGAFMNTLATVWDMVRPLGASETRAIGGDFNRNLLLANGAPSGAYNPLLPAGGQNYQLLVAPTAAGAPGNVDQYHGYFATHIRGRTRSRVSKFLWSDTAMNQSWYPGYGYVGSNFVNVPFYAIDNILVWPHQPAPYNYQTTIMNLVTGTPFNGVAAPGNAPPPGAIAMPSGFANPPAAGWPQAPTAAVYPGGGVVRRLTGWNNYGRIRNTSDHFAVFAVL